MKASRGKVVSLSRWKQHRQAIRETESLLMRIFPSKDASGDKEVVTVSPLRNFRRGKGVVVMTIPYGDILAREFQKVLEAVPHYPEEPGYVAPHGQKRLVVTFPAPDANDYEGLMEIARKLEAWARRVFAMQTVLSPLPNVRVARKRSTLHLRWK